jgi:hypothetical protein
MLRSRGATMQFIALIYNDPALLSAVPTAEADAMMRD